MLRTAVLWNIGAFYVETVLVAEGAWHPYAHSNENADEEVGCEFHSMRFCANLESSPYSLILR